MGLHAFYEAFALPVVFMTFLAFAVLCTSGTLVDNLTRYAAKYQKKLRDSKKDRSVTALKRFSWRARALWWLPLALLAAHAIWQGFTCWWLWNDELPVTSGKAAAVFMWLLINNLVIPFAAIGFFNVALGTATNVAIPMSVPCGIQWVCVIALYLLSHPLNATLQLVSAFVLTFIVIWIRGTEYARVIKFRPVLTSEGEECAKFRFSKRKCKQ